MHRMKNIWLLGVVILVAAVLLAPGLVQAQAKPGSGQGIEKEKIAQDLGLTPDQTKAFLAVGEKYGRSRQGIIEEIQKNEGELEQAMAAPQPDGAKIKGLVAAITAAHIKLWDTFRVQRREEMALLTPVQQGKFLLTLKRWHRQMCVKYEKQGKKN